MAGLPRRARNLTDKGLFKGGTMKNLRNPLRIDPTRTTGLRNKFWKDIRKRLLILNRSIQELLVKYDVFGMTPREPFTWNEVRNVRSREYEFLTDSVKVDTFRRWLQEQIDLGLLKIRGGDPTKPWTATYVDSAYKKGAIRAFMDSHKEEYATSPDFYEGSQRQFLSDMFMQPEVLRKVELMFIRSFEGMRGMSAEISEKLSRILADGLAHGRGPAEVAYQMRREITGIGKYRALMIARTEIIHAHAEGQLDAFEALGVKELGVMVEWAMGGDPCSNCVEMSKKGPYTIEDARGLIPLHPNCRCCWKPHVK